MAAAQLWGSSQGSNHSGERSGQGSNCQSLPELSDSAGSRPSRPATMGDDEDGGGGARASAKLQPWNGCFAGKQAFAQWRDTWLTQVRNPRRRSVTRKQQVWTAEDDCLLLMEWLDSTLLREVESKLMAITRPAANADLEGEPDDAATAEERLAFYISKYRVMQEVLQDPTSQRAMQQDQLRELRRSDIKHENIHAFRQRFYMLCVVGDDEAQPVLPWARLNTDFITAAWEKTVMRAEIPSLRREAARYLARDECTLPELVRLMEAHELAWINASIWDDGSALKAAKLEKEVERLRKQLEQAKEAKKGGGKPSYGGGQAVGGAEKASAGVKEVQVCHDFLRGDCRRGNACRFQHVAANSSQKDTGKGGADVSGGGNGGAQGGATKASWDCACGAHNYSHRTTCYTCHAPKPSGKAQQANAAAHLQRINSAQPVSCQLCGQPGHVARNCSQLLQQSRQQQPREQRHGNYAEGGGQHHHLPVAPFEGHQSGAHVGAAAHAGYTITGPGYAPGGGASAHGYAARMGGQPSTRAAPEPRGVYNPWAGDDNSYLWSGGYAAMSASTLAPAHDMHAAVGQLRATTEAQRLRQASRRVDDKDVQFQGPRGFVPGTEQMRANASMHARVVSVLQALNVSVNVLQMLESGEALDWAAFRQMVVRMATGKEDAVAEGPLKRALRRGFEQNKVTCSVPELYMVNWVAIVEQSVTTVFGASIAGPVGAADSATARRAEDLDAELLQAAAAVGGSVRAPAKAQSGDLGVETRVRQHHFAAALQAVDKDTVAGAIMASLPNDGSTYVETACFREVLAEGSPQAYKVNGMPVIELVHDSGCDHYRINDSKLPAEQREQLEWVAAAPGATSLADGTLSTGDQLLKGGAVITTQRGDGRIFRYYADTVYRSHGAAPAHLMGTGIMRALNLKADWQKRQISIQPQGWAQPSVTPMGAPSGVPPGVTRSFWCVGESLTTGQPPAEEAPELHANAATEARGPTVVADLPLLKELPQLHKQGLVRLSDRQDGLSVYEPCGGGATGLEALLVNGVKVGRYRYSDSNRKARQAAQSRV